MSENNKEIRYFDLNFESNISPESKVEGSKTLKGYAAVFNSESRDLGGFTEVISKGAFARSLANRNAAGQDIKALFNHEGNQIIGRTKNGSLTLREDDTGLYIEIIPPNTSLGRDVLAQVESGLIDKMSFGFSVTKDRWERSANKTPLRIIDEVELYEVSVVIEPAYLDTEVAVRSLAAHDTLDMKDAEIEAMISDLLNLYKHKILLHKAASDDDSAAK